MQLSKQTATHTEPAVPAAMVTLQSCAHVALVAVIRHSCLSTMPRRSTIAS